jgi:flagellar protein fliS
MSYKDDLVMKIATSNSCELVALQYQALIENTEDLKKYISEKNITKVDNKADKIRQIIAHLISSLGDEKSEFKDKSIDLYLYINQTMTNAIISLDSDKLDSIIKIFATQRDAWLFAGKNIDNTNKNVNISNAVTYGKKDVNINGSTTDFGTI